MSVEPMPNSTETLTDLMALLRPWRCCGAPEHCGAICQDDELSAILGSAARVVEQELSSRAAEGEHEERR